MPILCCLCCCFFVTPCRRLEAKKAEESRQDFEAQLAQQKAQLERLAAAMSALRAERDGVIMVGRHR
jgi:hypothetical protein